MATARRRCVGEARPRIGRCRPDRCGSAAAGLCRSAARGRIEQGLPRRSRTGRPAKPAGGCAPASALARSGAARERPSSEVRSVCPARCIGAGSTVSSRRQPAQVGRARRASAALPAGRRSQKFTTRVTRSLPRGPGNLRPGGRPRASSTPWKSAPSNTAYRLRARRHLQPAGFRRRGLARGSAGWSVTASCPPRTRLKKRTERSGCRSPRAARTSDRKWNPTARRWCTSGRSTTRHRRSAGPSGRGPTTPRNHLLDGVRRRLARRPSQKVVK